MGKPDTSEEDKAKITTQLTALEAFYKLWSEKGALSNLELTNMAGKFA